MDNGNFLDFAGSKLGVEVGFGKMILLYKEKTSLKLSDLTANAINADIESGVIVGVIKDWHSIAGASVAEVSVERTGTAEMKQIRAEIAADTINFEANMRNREVIGDLSEINSLNGILLDDQGNVFGDKSEVADELSTMLINFSGKATTSFQHDNQTDKMVSIVARYLVKDLSFIAANVETELIATKVLLAGALKTVTTQTATSLVFDMKVTDKGTGLPFSGTIAATDITVTGANVTSKTVAYVPATGILTLTLTGTGFVTDIQVLNITISGADFYSKAIPTVIRLGE